MKALEWTAVVLLWASGGLFFYIHLELQVSPLVAARPVATFWFLSGLLLAWSSCNRFHGGPRDFLRIGPVLGIILCLPLVPILVIPIQHVNWVIFISIFAGPLLGLSLSGLFRSQGKYLHSSRDLPDLRGELREAAERVLKGAGLQVLDIKISNLGSFNAMVQGLGRCTVVVDRRVTESFQVDEFSALIAHEAGHVRMGGILPYVAVVPAALAGFNAVAAAGWEREGQPALLICMLLLLLALVPQMIELACDRFAAARTSPGAMGKTLRKLFADYPTRVSEIAGSSLLIPFLSHPPLWVRLSAIGNGAARSLASYWAIWGATLLGFLILPIFIHAGFRTHLDERWHERLALGLPLAYCAGWLICRISLLLAAKSAIRASLGERRRGRWLLWPTCLSAFLFVGAAFFLDSAPAPTDAVVVPILAGSLLVLVLSLIGCLLTGALRSGPMHQPRRVRRALLESGAALGEGKPEEGLRIADEALRRNPHQPWLLTIRAAALIYLGRLDEAREILEKIISTGKGPTLAFLNLSIAQFLRGELKHAGELLEPLRKTSAGDLLVWYMSGLIALESRDLDRSMDFFEKACKLKEKNAPALAGRALAALERNDPLEEIQGWIDTARSAEPDNPLVLLTGAALHRRRGELEESRRSFSRALAELERKGFRGWIPYYNELGSRLGLVEETGTG